MLTQLKCAEIATSTTDCAAEARKCVQFVSTSIQEHKYNEDSYNKYLHCQKNHHTSFQDCKHYQYNKKMNKIIKTNDSVRLNPK